MTTPTTSPGQALLALIASDLATVGGQPLITLLQTWQKDAGNTLLQGAALLQFTASAPAAGITLEVEIEQQLLQLAITKVQSYLASKAAPTVAPAA
jgi:hypothetical protein